MPCFVKYQIMLAICFANAVILQKRKKKKRRKEIRTFAYAYAVRDKMEVQMKSCVVPFHSLLTDAKKR